ncbi:hypothetical protein [Massilia sp. H6]|uniref:hypothetical protein n=1 Tax=Massilia sp. H6 TaxID=2970464 RepID=UPI00216A748D|nr:hypothetical protein [Massilia sp. H6]UVW30668.1 hypothetical protein NRS07_20100 [Massilia sp. H6]
MKDLTAEKPFPETSVQMLATERDTAFFWSGKTHGIGGQDRAAEIAKAANGTTLEMTLAKRGIIPPVATSDNKVEVAEWWAKASADYATGASGAVRVVLGEKLRERNVWETKELPALKENVRVTRIVAIDPATQKETVLFDRSAEALRHQAGVDQNRAAPDIHHRAALAFAHESQEKAVKQHPTLAGAYAAMTVIEKQTHASGLTIEQQTKVVAAARENIAKNIQQGQYPDVKIREKHEVVTEHARER